MKSMASVHIHRKLAAPYGHFPRDNLSYSAKEKEKEQSGERISKAAFLPIGISDVIRKALHWAE